MPTIQTNGPSLSLGKDSVVIVVGPNGVNLQINKVTGFKSDAQYAEISSDGLDGVVNNVAIPKSWTYEIEFDRSDANVDEFVASIEEQWYDSGTIGTGQVYEYINEASGDQTAWLYDNATFMLNPGAWKSDSYVHCTLKGKCNRKKAGLIMPKTPSARLLEANAETSIATDKQGRSVKVRKLDALDKLDLIGIVGPEHCENPKYMEMCFVCFSVTEIDGVPAPIASNMKQLRATIRKLGDDGVTAAVQAFVDMTGGAPAPAPIEE